MNEIGAYYREARQAMGVELSEVSEDTNIPVIALEQIEDGSIGSFKDIFKLKEYLETYAKYLGLDTEKIIDEFNEYMFEYTSKIPIEDIEKKISEKELEEEKRKENQEIRAISPYLMSESDNKKTNKLIIIVIIIIILVALALIWAIKQMT